MDNATHSPLTRAFLAARPAAPAAGRPAANELLCAPAAGLGDPLVDPAARDADFVDFDCEANFRAVEQLVQLPDPKKKPDAKKDAKKEAPQDAPQAEAPQEAPEAAEDSEDVDEDALPGLLKPVELDVAARREVWEWLFDCAVERALHLFERADRLGALLCRAFNYAARGVAGSVDAE